MVSLLDWFVVVAEIGSAIAVVTLGIAIVGRNRNRILLSAFLISLLNAVSAMLTWCMLYAVCNHSLGGTASIGKSTEAAWYLGKRGAIYTEVNRELWDTVLRAEWTVTPWMTISLPTLIIVMGIAHFQNPPKPPAASESSS